MFVNDVLASVCTVYGGLCCIVFNLSRYIFIVFFSWCSFCSYKTFVRDVRIISHETSGHPALRSSKTYL